MSDIQDKHNEANKKRDEAERLSREAKELDAEADNEATRELSHLNQRISEVAEEERQARHDGDRDKELELSRQLSDLQAEKQQTQRESGSLF